MPDLAFTMQDANTGKLVTEANFRGNVLLLCFGYTNCPDICPTTLANLAALLQTLGASSQQVEILFVTVDPERDTPEILKAYTALFSSQITGLRGTPDQLASLARRYRVAYSVSSQGVTHSSLVFVFGRDGAARLLIMTMATSRPDVAGISDDLKRLLLQPVV